MRLIFVFSLAQLISSYQLNAQLWDWAKGGGADEGVSICMDRIGGFYLASTRGYSTFLGSPMGNAQTGEVISRHDLSGNLLWAQKIIQGNIACITADRFGNCYATGSCNSATFCGLQGNMTVVHPPDLQAFIVKYDYNGNVLWVKTWDYPNLNDRGLGIKADDFGNTVVTGVDDRTFQQGGPSSNFFILKFDAQGSLLWSKESNWRGSFASGSIDIDDQNNIYIAGTFVDSAVFSNTILYDGTFLSIAVAKYDKNGNFIWAKIIGTSSDVAAGFVLDHKGYFYLTGSFYNQTSFGNVTISSPPQLGSCVFIAKFDTSCNCIWARSSQKRSGVSVASDTSGNCYMAGNMIGAASFGSGTNSVTFNGPKNTQLFVVKFDALGNLLWGVCPGGSSGGYNSVGAICTDLSGKCYVTGSCDQTNFGVTTLTTTGVFIARIGPQLIITPGTGTSVISVPENSIFTSLNIFPNPNRGQFFLQYTTNSPIGTLQIAIRNVVGQIVYEKKYEALTGLTDEIRLDHLPKGIYFIELKNDKAREVKKIIIE